MKKLIVLLLLLAAVGIVGAAQTTVNTSSDTFKTAWDRQQAMNTELYGSVGALIIGTDVQAYDADLTTYAGITPAANTQSLLAASDYAAMRGLLDLEAGTDFYSTSAADTLFGACVATTGNETVAGVKTFSSFPVGPTAAPTTDYQIANKKYVDDNSGGSASISDAVYDSSWNGDTTNGASKNVIYGKIETLAGGHDAVTLASGVNALTLSTQEIGVDAAVEGLADATLPSAKSVFYYNGSSYEWATSLGVDIVLYDESPDTAGQLTYDAATNVLELYSTSAVRTFSNDAAIAGVATITASGFDGNLATTDDTIQEVAQALDDVVILDESANETITGDWTFEGDITIGNLADDSITTSMIATDAVTMDAVDADGTFTSLTGAWRTTGVLQGAVGVTSDTTATITLGAADCLGNLRINGDDDVIDYTLPTAAAGLSITIYSSYAAVVTIDCNNTSDIIVLDGTALTAGNAVDSPGTVGDFICLVAISDSTWLVLGKAGTWVDGGAD